jgi:hypothetical protein
MTDELLVHVPVNRLWDALNDYADETDLTLEQYEPFTTLAFRERGSEAQVHFDLTAAGPGTRVRVSGPADRDWEADLARIAAGLQHNGDGTRSSTS